jgi:two-component system, OmpR family, phosphate regulon sensor histidine kinase PhoR
MFWRAFLTLVLLQWTVLAILGLALGQAMDQPDGAGRAESRQLIFEAGVLLTVASAAVCGVLSYRLRRSLRELTLVAERIATGPVGQHVFLNGGDEVGQLGRTFNQVSEQLAVRIAQLEEDRQQLRTILSGMVEGVVALDPFQRILYANERASQLLEFANPAPVGRRLWEVVRQRPLLDIVQQALNRPEPSRQEFNWTGLTTRSLTVHAARLPGKPPRGAVLVLHDTSELRRLERLRQEFVANVSHELKTPLSVIKACVETLVDGAVDDIAHRGGFLTQIASQSNRLHSLILDLLSLARIESGEELFEFDAIPVEEVVAACPERHHSRAETRRQSLEMEPPPLRIAETRACAPRPDGSRIEDKNTSEVGAVSAASSNPQSAIRNPQWSDPQSAVVWADEEALEQILDNLLDNALKYTPEGGRITVRWYTGAEQVCLEVADTGIGIPEADLPRIFERFYRVDKARSREMGGTGLGLSIVKHLAQAMRGSVKAASRVGAGTTFTVCLPRPGTTSEQMSANRADSSSQFHQIYT